MRLPAAFAAALSLVTAPAFALDPWVDPDPAAPPERHVIGSVGVVAEAEYRAQLTHVTPLSLTSEDQRLYSVLENRLRVGATLDYEEKVKLTTSLDLLDGVLWGDNGAYGGSPSADSGLKVTARNPNLSRPCMTPVPGGDPLDPAGYGWGLCEASAVKVRRLFAQINTPVGALRIGRQPVSIGMGVQNTDGDGRRNRFGVAYAGDSVDRILFATKPLEALKPKEQRDTDENRGFIVAGMYDRMVTASPTDLDDDVNQAAIALRYVAPELGRARDLEVLFFYARRWNPEYETRVNSFGGRAAVKLANLHAGLDMVGHIGTTKEVAAAYSLITNDPVLPQQIAQLGTRAVVRWDEPRFTAYLEFDYASGDADPQAGSPLTQFRFAEDTNVGLLMFEHALHFQSARAAAAAVEITRRLGAETFPAERINTRGAFTDALAIFPQVDVRPVDNVLLRGGVLVAWAPAPVVEQVQSLTRRDGQQIADDLVNFVGGKPGDFYGVELDARAQWRFVDHFALDLEAAVLFPGNAFQDANGRAANSVLVQGRTTAFF
ncbi:MAG: alginate export family protein [Deltaproteobacteria bacterium]|nr:alginate export family protein [Deltaproteobacteria bacterium]